MVIPPSPPISWQTNQKHDMNKKHEQQTKKSPNPTIHCQKTNKWKTSYKQQQNWQNPTILSKLLREKRRKTMTDSTSPPWRHAPPFEPVTCWGAGCSWAAVQIPGSHTPAWWQWRCRRDPGGGCSCSGPAPGEVSQPAGSSSPGGALLSYAMALLVGDRICEWNHVLQSYLKPSNETTNIFNKRKKMKNEKTHSSIAQFAVILIWTCMFEKVTIRIFPLIRYIFSCLQDNLQCMAAFLERISFHLSDQQEEKTSNNMPPTSWINNCCYAPSKIKQFN